MPCRASLLPDALLVSKSPCDLSVNAAHDFLARIRAGDDIFEVVFVQKVLADYGELNSLLGMPAQTHIHFEIVWDRGGSTIVVETKRAYPAQSRVQLGL